MSRLLPLLCAGALGLLPVQAAEKDRILSLPLAPGATFKIDAGAGYLKVEGREGQTTIEVKARIVADRCDEKELEEMIQDRVELVLEKSSSGARLKAEVRNGGARSWFSLGNSARIDLIVTVPKHVRLTVQDGSGALEVRNIQGDVDIEDGSGEMVIEQIHGNVSIEDGSGSISVRNVTGDVGVDDGSGGMTIAHAGGTVTVHDGSGDIDIDDVGKDVHLKSTGSGGVHTRNVRGRILR